jgi:hypothetical protein
LSRLVPAIHVLLLSCRKKDVDARDKRGHDVGEEIRSHLERAQNRNLSQSIPIGFSF